MELVVRLEERTWDREKHLRHISEGQWQPMLDADGKVLARIEGMVGVSGTKKDRTRIGADFVRMHPGARFPLHEHVGDHEIYFIDGDGFVHIDGQDIAVRGGHLIHIPGEYPHGVWVAEDARCPLVFTAVGHPHKHVHAPDRMLHPYTR